MKITSRPVSLLVLLVALGAASAHAGDSDTGRNHDIVLVDHSRQITYVSAVEQSTLWVGERVTYLGSGQCEKITQRLVGMRHMGGIDLPNVAKSKEIAPCRLIAPQSANLLTH